MKSFGKTLLTIYLTITTLAAGIFGFLYFKDKDFRGQNSVESLSVAVIKTVVTDFINSINVTTNSTNGVNNENTEYNANHVVYADDNFDISQYY